MNINYIQFEKLKGCTSFEISEHSIIGYKRNKEARVVKITNKQYAQPHDRLVYGYKWNRMV